MKAFKAFINPFEASQRNLKIKIYVNFLCSSETGTGRVNIKDSDYGHQVQGGGTPQRLFSNLFETVKSRDS